MLFSLLKNARRSFVVSISIIWNASLSSEITNLHIMWVTKTCEYSLRSSWLSVTDQFDPLLPPEQQLNSLCVGYPADRGNWGYGRERTVTACRHLGTGIETGVLTSKCWWATSVIFVIERVWNTGSHRICSVIQDLNRIYLIHSSPIKSIAWTRLSTAMYMSF